MAGRPRGGPFQGLYGQYGVRSLNHGIGYATAAIELLLPTYAERLGLKGKICTHWALNPHPALIPAIESGFVEAIHCFGSEAGTEDYVKARSDIFFVGPDRSLRSNRAFAQADGHYATDAFVGATLQIDRHGNSSTAVADRIAGFGALPIWVVMLPAAGIPVRPGQKQAKSAVCCQA